MTSQQLKCFVLVADKLNFTKAAEEMFLSVPTVTHNIKTRK
jgi:DNA-binding transcriptional LysR family regulator